MIRRSVVVVAAVLCAAGTAFAQAPPPAAHADWQAKCQQWQQKWQGKRAQMEQKRMERLAVLLDMSAAQQRQVEAIFKAEHAQMRQAMKQAMAARRAAHTETVTKLGQVLSPLQMKKLKLLMPQRHHGIFMMRGPMGMHGRMGMQGGMGMQGPMGMHGPMGMCHPHRGNGGRAPPAAPGPQ